jgi:sulfoxide reductase catalytic subunit YedY
MHYLKRPPWHLRESRLTDELEFERFTDRRRFLKQSARAGVGAVGLGAIGGAGACRPSYASNPNTSGPGKDLPLVESYDALLSAPGFPPRPNLRYDIGRPLTEEAVAGSHNNFYEFTTTKDEVYKLTGDFQPRPWTLEVTGAVDKPLTLDVDDLAKLGYEERRYRFRCVEAWAMAVPWTGVPLRKLIEMCKPLSKARFVRFVSFKRPEQARGQRLEASWPWPYFEALKMKEAMNELALLVTGIYGHALPRQHGAPVRLMAPWKYGYKNIKSITRIEFTEVLPRTFWNTLQPKEYDFDGNVNPKLPHPRWSQAREKMIGSGRVYDTQWLNGYAPLLDDVIVGRQPVKHGWENARSPF